EIAPRHRQRGVVDIDRLPAGGTVGHRPITVAPGTAAQIEKCFAAPVFGPEMHRPIAELLLVFRAHLGITVPFIAEAVGRAGCQNITHARALFWPEPMPRRRTADAAPALSSYRRRKPSKGDG